MTLSRRGSIRAFGMALASLLLARCKVLRSLSTEPRDRLRQCWLSFSDLASKTSKGQNQGSDGWDNPFGQNLSAEHRRALDELVAAGEIETPVADLVQEAYDAAIYHVWRSNAPITCYEPVMVDYAPASAGQLVQQSAVLAEMADDIQLDPDTVAVAHQAIERDLAFEALTDQEVQALYQTIIDESNQGQKPAPSFDEAVLDITPEAQKAAQFLVDLLTER